MSALESSVTLEDVFAVVEGKRVPLAPELAGYLTLEIADGTEASGGIVDPRTVYISEEGTVALVRPKKDGATGDAETSVRGILAKLLDASGSATPALSASAKRKPGAGLPALVSELEAALIPVNRAAGRRALARLAREVKRVTLGVGRNASMPPPSKAPAAIRQAPVVKESPEDVMSGPDAPPGPRASFTDEAQTAKRTNQLQELAAQMGAPDIIVPPSADAPRKPFVPSMGLTPPPLPGEPAKSAAQAASEAETAVPPGVSPGPPPFARATARGPGASLPPPPARPVVGPPPRAKGAAVGPPGAPERRAEKLFEGDEVDSLLSTFEVSNVGEKQLRTDLKAIAGLDPTPAPPDARTLAELTKDVGKDLPKSRDRDRDRDRDSVEALLALADTSGPLAPLLPPPNFTRSADDDAAILPPASVAQPGSPFATAGRALPETPSPLIPISPAGTGHSPFASTAVAEAIEPPPPVKRSPTPARSQKATGPAPAPPPTSSRREKLDATLQARKTTNTSFRQARAPRTGLAMLVLTLFVLVAGGIAVWMFKPAFFTGNKKRPLASASINASAAPPPAPKCKVALVVADVPANAEILLRMGPAPLDVERMPVGTRLEFVGTAEGYVPRRAVIKAESPWEKTSEGKPRIDVPIQLDPTKAKPGALDPWPAAEPGSQVGGSGSPGTVHVVSNVRGAEIWLLAGLGPEARIEQLRCDGDIDVLLAGPPQLRKRLHVSEKDIQAATPDAQGNRVVSVSGKSPAP